MDRKELFWKSKKVMVTGAGGFIGSHLVEKLVSEGAQVSAFVRYTSRPQAGFIDTFEPEIRHAVRVIRGDLRDYQAVLKAIEGNEVVFHLGALIGIPYSYEHPWETIDTNVIGSLNVLTAARETRVSRIVQTSSSEVYGTARYVPIDEAHPLQGQSPYSASKISADKIAESYFDSFSLPVVILRPFNTYGPRQSTRAVIPTIITQLLAGKQLKLGNLAPRRDFTFVSDTVDGFLCAGESVQAIGKTINLGTSVDISIADLVSEISTIMGKSLDVQVESVRIRPLDSEVQRLLSQNRLALELLNWRPKVDLHTGLEKTVDWITNNLQFFQNIGEYSI